MRTLAILVIIAYSAVTSCNNTSSNSNANGSNTKNSDSSSKSSNISSSNNSDNKSNSSTASDNKNNQNTVDNNKKATRTAVKYDYEVAVGASFSIELGSNPTTGYRWHWVNRSSVSTVDTTGYKYVSSHPGMMGSGGKETWIFTGKKAGTDSLKFQYNRSWEKKPAVNLKEFSVKVD
ncbi:MAG: protease inhibitor I42 family protein [Bacteroidales bacterium]|jgi:inhibitor of cysteine peptidase